MGGYLSVDLPISYHFSISPPAPTLGSSHRRGKASEALGLQIVKQIKMADIIQSIHRDKIVSVEGK